MLSVHCLSCRGWERVGDWCPLSGDEVAVELLQLSGRDAHSLELAEEVVHLALHELVTSRGHDLLLGVGADKESQPALGVDDAAMLQVVVGARHGVGVDLDLGGELSDARHLPVGGECSSEDLVADAVCDLQIDCLIILEIHDSIL